MARIKMENGFPPESKFIVFEGGEASGKSTMAKRLALHYEKTGKRVCLTREPGGVRVAEEIRSLLLSSRSPADCLDGLSEALLFAAARNEHLLKKVIPALRRGEIVIMDRYFYSSLAYQGYGRQLGFEQVQNINRQFIESFRPDLAIYLNVSPWTQAARLQRRQAGEMNHWDRESGAFMARVGQGFKRCETLFDEFVNVNAEQTEDVVFKDVLQLTNSLWRKADSKEDNRGGLGISEARA